MRVQMYGCVFTHFATHHFEDATLASERTPWWWHHWHAETCWRFIKSDVYIFWCMWVGNI